MVVVGSALKGRPAARMGVRDLRDRGVAAAGAGSGTREAMDQALLPHLHAYRRTIELGSSEAIKHAAGEGLGLAFLSRWVVADWLASEGWSNSRPRCRPSCGSATGSFTATSS